MKRIYYIVILVTALLSGCGKHVVTPEEDNTKVPIGFSAVSETAKVKASQPLSAFHGDFGVWGIARKDGQADYMLWAHNSMTKAEKIGNSNVYSPTEEAFWLSGYTYNFIAIAPFESGADKVNFLQRNGLERDAMIFSYDMAGQYQKNVFDYDMMAAVAETSVAKSTTHPSQQNLAFWHIFSQINIAVNFKDATGNTTKGVARLRLHNVDQDITYCITSVANVTTDEVSLNATYTNNETTLKVDPIVFNETNDRRTDADPEVNTWRWTLNIVPQNIENFKLYLDYTVEGITYRDYEINLFPDTNTPTEYGYNQQYNWNITIRPKDDISFNVSIAPWDEQIVSDNDSDDNNEIEII